MGKSIIEQYQAGQFEVMHKGEEAEFVLPSWTEPLQAQDFNFWSREHIQTFLDSLPDTQFVGLFHSSLKDEAVSMRAVTRPGDKESIITLQPACQTRLTAYRPSPLANPAERKVTSKKAVLDQKWSEMEPVLRANGLDEKTIASMKENFYK